MAQQSHEQLDRIFPYLTLLVMVMGAAVTLALQDSVGLLSQNSQVDPIRAISMAIRLASFLVLAVRWVFGSVWFIQSHFGNGKNVGCQTPNALAIDFLWILSTFILFVPLAKSITVEPNSFVGRTLSTWGGVIMTEQAASRAGDLAFMFVLLVIIGSNLMWREHKIRTAQASSLAEEFQYWRRINGITFATIIIAILLYCVLRDSRGQVSIESLVLVIACWGFRQAWKDAAYVFEAELPERAASVSQP